MASSFRIESTVRGHHVFKEVWTPITGEELEVNVEPSNPHDEYAVAVWKGGVVVGHVPREITRTCWFFLQKRDSRIHCVVTGHRQRSQVPGKGLVVPCLFVFTGKSKHLEKLISIYKAKYS